MPVQLKEEMGHYDIFCDSTSHNLRIHTFGAENEFGNPEYNAVTGIVDSMACGEPQTLILGVCKEQLGHILDTRCH
jgi:hypothetical protein